MSDSRHSRGVLTRMVVIRGLAIFVVMAALLFLPAGTLSYWQAWVYLAIVFIPGSLAIVYLLQNDPGLLERRMRLSEKEPVQRNIQKISFVYFLIIFVLPGLDRRFEWSDVPTLLVVAADALLLLGYGVFVLVLKENPYASRVIEVEEGQRVITTGPYAIIRHPMYLGAFLIYACTPLSLGSYWAMIPSVFLVPLLMARIQNEEAVLVKELAGYREYMQRTKYRLIPGLW